MLIAAVPPLVTGWPVRKMPWTAMIMSLCIFGAAGLQAGRPVGVGTLGPLLGLGVRASVSPALFAAGFSLRSAQIQRVFALIELLRAVTAFLIALVLLFLATAVGGSSVAGTHTVIWICLGTAAIGGVATVTLYVLGGSRLPTPDLERWTGDGEPAWHSPPLLSTLRRSRQPERPREAERVGRLIMLAGTAVPTMPVARPGAGHMSGCQVSGSAASSGQTAMWSASSRNSTRSRMPSRSVIPCGSWTRRPVQHRVVAGVHRGRPSSSVVARRVRSRRAREPYCIGISTFCRAVM